MATFNISRSGSVYGISFSDSYQTTTDGGRVLDGVTLAASKSATLTTFSSSSAVTLTAEASHGITTASVVDVAWNDVSSGTSVLKVRYSCTVGTVSGTTVPIASGGTGDAFTNVVGQTYRLFTPLSETFVVPASSTDFILVKLPNGAGVVRFLDGSDAVVYAVSRNVSGSSTYIWNSATDGSTSPFGSTAIAKVLWSNLSTTAQTPVAVVGFDS